MTNLLTITSVPAETVEAGKMQITVSWKSTEKRTIPAANKARAVTVPADIWAANLPSDKPDLRAFMHGAIYELAKDFLTSIVEESNWQRTEVNADAFTLDKLLAWNAERAAASGRLSSAEIEAWLAESVTVKRIRQSHGDAIVNGITKKLAALASPNPGWKQPDAEKMLKLWDNSDTDSITGYKVLKVVQRIAKPRDENNVFDSIE